MSKLQRNLDATYFNIRNIFKPKHVYRGLELIAKLNIIELDKNKTELENECVNHLTNIYHFWLPGNDKIYKNLCKLWYGTKR